MTLPTLVKVEWENGDVTIERLVSISANTLIYNLDEKIHGNLWAYASMCTFVDPVAESPEIRIGQIFTVEGRKYVIVQPKSPQQLQDSNDHGHLVITLVDI